MKLDTKQQEQSENSSSPQPGLAGRDTQLLVGQVNTDATGKAGDGLENESEASTRLLGQRQQQCNPEL